MTGISAARPATCGCRCARLPTQGPRPSRQESIRRLAHYYSVVTPHDGGGGGRATQGSHGRRPTVEKDRPEHPAPMWFSPERRAAACSSRRCGLAKAAYLGVSHSGTFTRLLAGACWDYPDGCALMTLSRKRHRSTDPKHPKWSERFGTATPPLQALGSGPRRASPRPTSPMRSPRQGGVVARSWRRFVRCVFGAARAVVGDAQNRPDVTQLTLVSAGLTVGVEPAADRVSVRHRSLPRPKLAIRPCFVHKRFSINRPTWLGYRTATLHRPTITPEAPTQPGKRRHWIIVPVWFCGL